MKQAQAQGEAVVKWVVCTVTFESSANVTLLANVLKLRLNVSCGSREDLTLASSGQKSSECLVKF